MTWWQAAEVIGISDRQMRRWRRRYEKFGYDGLWDWRCRRPSPLRVPLEQAERVVALYGEKYFDFYVRHFHEKLRDLHGIALSYTWSSGRFKVRVWCSTSRPPASHRTAASAAHSWGCV